MIDRRDTLVSIAMLMIPGFARDSAEGRASGGGREGALSNLTKITEPKIAKNR